MPMTKKEKLEIINQYINALQLKNQQFYSAPYNLRNDAELDELIRNQNGAVIKSASDLDDTIAASRDTDALKRDFGLDVKDDPIAQYLLDFNYVCQTGENREAVMKKNRQLAKDLHDPAKRRKLIEDRLLSILRMDISKMATGSLSDRLEYMKGTINNSINLYQIQDFIQEYQRFDDRNTDFEDLLEERKSELQFYGGICTMTAMLRQDYYPLLKDFNFLDLGELYDSDSKLQEKANKKIPLTDVEQVKHDFLEVLKKSQPGTVTFEQLDSRREIYKALADNGILDGGGDAVRFYSVDSEGKKIPLSKAIDLMAENQSVTFKERSQEFVNYFSEDLPKEKKPEIIENGREITFTGARITKIKELPNPVEQTLERFKNDNEEVQAAGKWFESFKQYLDQSQDFDLNNKYDTCRISKFRLGGIDRKDIQLDTYFTLENNPSLDTLNPENVPSFNTLTDDQKLTLFRCARQGSLVFNDKNMNSTKLKAIYVKDDGTFGMSTDVLANFPTAGNNPQTQTKVDPDIYKKLFPDAKNAKELTIQYRDYDLARGLELMMRSGSDPIALSEKMALRKLESVLIIDAKSNPQFYTSTELAESRRDLIRDWCKGAFATDNPAWEAFIDTMEKHNFLAYKNAVDSLTAKTGKPIAEILNSGMVSKGGPGYRSELYIPDRDAKPWDTVDAITHDITDGDSVYLTIPGDNGQMKEYILGSDNQGLKFNEVLSVNDYRRVQDNIAKLAERINATGITGGDSEEFNRLRTICKELASDLPDEKEDFQNKMRVLNKAADDYCRAKSGQPKNSRRSERLSIANEIRDITNDYEAEFLTDSQKTSENEKLSTLFRSKNMEYRSTGGENFKRHQSHRILVKTIVNGKPEFHPIGYSEDTLEDLMLHHQDQLTGLIAKGELYLYRSGEKYPSQVLLQNGAYTLSDIKTDDNLTALPERPNGLKRMFGFLNSGWQDQERTYQNALQQRNAEQQILTAAQKRLPNRSENVLASEREIEELSRRKQSLELFLEDRKWHEETMERLDDTYGPTFKANRSLVEKKILNPEKYNVQSFAVPDRVPLDKRDVAILVYAACANKKNQDLSPENAPDNMKSYHDRHYLLMQGTLYGLRGNILNDDPRYIPIVKGARQQVADVLAQYSPSDPKPVIKILCEGLKLNNKEGLSLPGDRLSYQNAECLHFSGEILRVLNKIPGGLKTAMNEGLLQKEDIDVATALYNIAEIALKSRKAQAKLYQSELNEIQGLNAGLSDQEKSECCKAVFSYQMIGSVVNKAFADSKAKKDALLDKIGKKMSTLSVEKNTALQHGNQELANQKQNEYLQLFNQANTLYNETQLDRQAPLFQQMAGPDAQKAFEKSIVKTGVVEDMSHLSLKEINDLCDNGAMMMDRYKNQIRPLTDKPTIENRQKVNGVVSQVTHSMSHRDVPR